MKFGDRLFAVPIFALWTTIVQFLERDSQAIITLFSDVHIAASAQREFIKAFYDSGAYKYLHIQDSNKPWPQLGTLRKTNKRLITFFDEKFLDNLLVEFPWVRGIHQTNRFIAANAWTHISLSDLADSSGAIGYVDVEKSAALYLMYHFVTPPISKTLSGISGSASLAEVANSNPLLNNKTNKFKTRNGKWPNFIVVDFYDQGFQSLHDLAFRLSTGPRT